MFFDPKVRGDPRPMETWRGKSGHHRAGCRASFTASAGGTRQGVSTDSVTENKPLRETRVAGASGDGDIAADSRIATRAARVKRWSKSPPRQRQRWRHEKPRPVQGKIGGWAARPTATGMLHPPPPGRSRQGDGGQLHRKVDLREMTTEAPQGAEQNPAYRSQSSFSNTLETRVGRRSVPCLMSSPIPSGRSPDL